MPFPKQGTGSGKSVLWLKIQGQPRMAIKVTGFGGTRDMFLRYMKETGKLPFLEEGVSSRIGSLHRPSRNRWAARAFHGRL